MTSAQVFLGLTVFSTGLFRGLLMTVLFFFERALKDLSGPEFALVMQRFLKITRSHPLNYAMVLTSALAPIAVLALLREEPSSPAFVLTAAGLLAFWCGPVFTSSVVAQRVYGVFMICEPDAPPPNGRVGPVVPRGVRRPAFFGVFLWGAAGAPPPTGGGAPRPVLSRQRGPRVGIYASLRPLRDGGHRGAVVTAERRPP